MGLLKRLAKAVLAEDEQPDAEQNDSGGERCPKCGAPESRRMEACGFGKTRPIICGQCGHQFGVRIIP